MKMNPSKSLNEKIAEQAEEFLKYFKRITRNNGAETYILNDDTPQELECLVYKAHHDFFCDDFRYETIHDALCAFADCGIEDELNDVRVEADIYNHDLLKWLSSHFNRIAYCDEDISEFGLQNTDMMTLIIYGQQMEKDEIVSSVLESLIALCE